MSLKWTCLPFFGSRHIWSNTFTFVQRLETVQHKNVHKHRPFWAKRRTTKIANWKTVLFVSLSPHGRISLIDFHRSLLGDLLLPGSKLQWHKNFWSADWKYVSEIERLLCWRLNISYNRLLPKRTKILRRFQQWHLMESKSKGDRFTALAHGSHVGLLPPSALVVDQFAAERAKDAQKLLAAVKDVPAARHLRRRARSWRPFGLSRCRVAKAAAQRKVKRRTLKDAEAVATRMASEKQGGQETVRVRKHWRRPALLLQAHAWASPTVASSLCRFLETHVWHAKRSHMENVWGHRLASRNSALGTRALVKATRRYCCGHDRSYMQILELFGSESMLVDVLGSCGIDSRLLLAKEARAGLRRVRGLLKAGDRLIGPVYVLWSPCMVSQKEPAEKEMEEEEEVLPFVLDVLGENAEDVQAKVPAEDVKAHQDVEMDEPKAPEIIETAWKLWLWIHPAAVAEVDPAVSLADFLRCALPQAMASLTLARTSKIQSCAIFPMRSAKAAEQVRSKKDEQNGLFWSGNLTVFHQLSSIFISFGIVWGMSSFLESFGTVATPPGSCESPRAHSPAC